MHVTVFGIIWVFVLITTLIFNKNKNIIMVAFFGMIFQCNNIVVIGSVGIGVQVFTIATISIYAMLFKKRHVLPSRIVCGRVPIRPLMVILSLLFSSIVVSLIANNCISTHGVSVLIIFFYVLFTKTILDGRIYICADELDNVVNKIVACILFIGVVQVICKSGMSFLQPVLRTFIYNDTSNSNVIFNFKENNALYSTFMEPSFCGALLIGFLALIATRNSLSKKNITMIIFILLEVILTRSSTAYVGLIVVVCFLLFTRAEKRVYKYILPCIILGGSILVVMRMDILNEVLFEKINSSSYAVRNNWNLRSLKSFYDNPVVGVGYGNSRASSLLYTIMGELGIIGLTIYLSLLILFLRKLFSKHISKREISFSLMVVAIMICQIIACPDLNFSPFWLAVFVYSAQKYDNELQFYYKNRDCIKRSY